MPGVRAPFPRGRRAARASGRNANPGPGERQCPRDALCAPTVASHLCPPRPRHRHRPARHAQPSSQRQGGRHLAPQSPNLSPGPSTLAPPPARGGSAREPASGSHWLRRPLRASPTIPLVALLGRLLPFSPEGGAVHSAGSATTPEAESFHPIGFFCQLEGECSTPLASTSGQSEGSFVIGRPSSSFAKRVSHSIGRFRRPGGIFLQLALLHHTRVAPSPLRS